MSEVGATDLLRALGSGVTPIEAPSRVSNMPGLDFGKLLDRARTGEIRSGLTVTPDVDAGIELNQEQTELMSRIADIAQAQGIQQVLVSVGDAQYLLDVERRVLTNAPIGPDGLVTGIDAAVRIDGKLTGITHANQDSLSVDAILRGLGGIDRSVH